MNAHFTVWCKFIFSEFHGAMDSNFPFGAVNQYFLGVYWKSLFT